VVKGNFPAWRNVISLLGWKWYCCNITQAARYCICT